MHEVNCFVTLTYNDEKQPYGGTLVRSHFQKFIKRYRSRIEPKKLRYFMCGEYGDQLLRPHYHALIFGNRPNDLELWKTKDGTNTYTSDWLESVWGKGFVTVGDVTWQSAAYVSRYVTKKRTGKTAEQHYQRIVESTGELIQLEPEYISMSLKPAIGRTWYEANRSDCYPKDFITNKGTKYRVPKYYDKLLEREEPQELERLKELRKQNAWKWDHEQTRPRLAARERCQLARASQLKRSYEQ